MLLILHPFFSSNKSFIYEFIRNSTSRELNYTYWDSVPLQMKFQKDFIDSIRISAAPNIHDHVAFLPKCQLVAFHAATINRSDIFTSDRAHRFVLLEIIY